MPTRTRLEGPNPPQEGPGVEGSVASSEGGDTARSKPAKVRRSRFLSHHLRAGAARMHSYPRGIRHEPVSGRTLETTLDRRAVPGLPAEERTKPAANERFKKAFGALFWFSLILATGAHFAVFAFWPDMTAEVVSYSSDELTAIVLPPEIEIPAPPEAIARPAVPVIATGNIDEDITIAPTTFESNPVRDLPPPPTLEEVSQADLSAAPTFTPYTVRPDIRNREEVRRALEREYPSILRDAGLGGTVQVWFFIDEEGKVVRTQIQESSGQTLLDQAALKVADIIQFSPALNRDKRVPVWISLPITFVAR
jgi:protein TonB